MELWIGAEFSGDIGNELREARNFVEDQVNLVIRSKNYDLELESWDCVLVLMVENDYEEIVKYSKAKKDMDFRLKINHKQFSEESALGQQSLIYLLLNRSINLLSEKGLNTNGLELLRTDLNSIARKKQMALEF